MNQWWIIVDGEKSGPYTADDIVVDFDQYKSGTQFQVNDYAEPYTFTSVEAFLQVEDWLRANELKALADDAPDNQGISVELQSTGPISIKADKMREQKARAEAVASKAKAGPYRSIVPRAKRLSLILKLLSYLCLNFGVLTMIFGFFYSMWLMVILLQDKATDEAFAFWAIVTSLGTYVILTLLFMIGFAVLQFLALNLEIKTVKLEQGG